MRHFLRSDKKCSKIMSTNDVHQMDSKVSNPFYFSIKNPYKIDVFRGRRRAIVGRNNLLRNNRNLDSTLRPMGRLSRISVHEAEQRRKNSIHSYGLGSFILLGNLLIIKRFILFLV